MSNPSPLPGDINRLAQYLHSSPFGMYCGECRTPLDSGSVKYHMATKHPGVVTCNYRGLLAAWRKKCPSPILTTINVDDYIKGPITSGHICMGCSLVFDDRSKAKRHIVKKCRGHQIAMVSCRSTICGRLVPMDALLSVRSDKFVQLPPLSTAPAQVPSPYNQSCYEIFYSDNPSITTLATSCEEKVGPFVVAEESPATYARLFHNIISKANDLSTVVKTMLAKCSLPKDNEQDLSLVLEVGTTWINDYYATHVFLCPADMRAATISFDGQVVGDTNMKTTFVPRSDTAPLLRILLPLLCYGWRHSTNPFAEYKLELNSDKGPPPRQKLISTGFVPRMLTTLITLPPSFHFSVASRWTVILSLIFK